MEIENASALYYLVGAYITRTSKDLFVGVWKLISCDAIYFKEGTKFRAGPTKMRAAYESEIDEEHGIVNHIVPGGLFPDWTGSLQPRHYKFEGNRLILSTDPIGFVSKEKTVVTLAWKRLN